MRARFGSLGLAALLAITAAGSADAQAKPARKSVV